MIAAAVHPPETARPSGGIASIVLFGALSFLTAITAVAQFEEVESRVSEFTLANGLTFVVLERHQAPVVSCFTLADVGSAQEVEGITGLAHMFEHMAFKGTSRIGTKNYSAERKALAKVDHTFAALQAERHKGRKAEARILKELEASFQAAQEEAERFVVPNEYAAIVERAGGGELNASTWHDATSYYVALPSHGLELWFCLESERFRDPVLRQFYKERDVVLEERRRGVENSPTGKLYEEFVGLAYRAHPYGLSGWGHTSDLQSLTRADAEAFFRKYYVTSNLTCTLVGDVNRVRVRELAQSYFGRLRGRPKPEPLRTVEPPQSGERRVTLRLAAQRLVWMGYHMPDINDPDFPACEALGSLMSEGRSSRLHRVLVRDRKMAVDVGRYPGWPGVKYPGLLLFYASVAPGHSNAEVEKSMIEETERLVASPVDEEELQGVKRRSRADLLRTLESNDGMAEKLATYQVLMGSWRELFRAVARTEALTPGDLQRVARKMFTPDNRTIAVIEPIEPSATP